MTLEGRNSCPDHSRRSRTRVRGTKAKTRARQGVDVTGNLTYQLIVLTNSLSRSAGREFQKEVGLTVPEWRILSVLGSNEPMTLAALTRILAVDKGWVSRTVIGLEQRGHVLRSPDPRDERVFTIELTASGVQRYLDGSKVSLRRQKELAAAFTAEELEDLYEALERMRKVAEAMEARV